MISKAIHFKNSEVSYSVKGEGHAVVLLHGFLGSKEIWEMLFENLSKSYKVIAIDLPGHGATPCIGYAHSMELMAKSVKAVLDKLKLRKYVLIGHSMGGYVSLAFAQLYSNNLRGLCMYHSTANPDSEEKKKDRIRAIKLVKTSKNVFTKSTIENLFATKNLKYLKPEIKFANTIARKTSKEGIIAALHGMKDREDSAGIISELKIPVMYIIGKHDNVLPSEILLAQTNLLKNKAVLFLEHSGHLGFLETPFETQRQIRKFLRRCFKN